jgi:CheY-like chemotaxis protein
MKDPQRNSPLTTVKTRLLLVDGCAASREVFFALLAGQKNVEVVAAVEDGTRAVASVREWSPDVVLIDIATLKSGGIEICQGALDAHPSLSVVFLAASSEPLSVMGAFRAGATGYLLKSDPGNELFAAIRAVSKGGIYLSPALLHPAGFVTMEIRYLIEQVHHQYGQRRRCVPWACRDELPVFHARIREATDSSSDVSVQPSRPVV